MIILRHEGHQIEKEEIGEPDLLYCRAVDVPGIIKSVGTNDDEPMLVGKVLALGDVVPLMIRTAPAIEEIDHGIRFTGIGIVTGWSKDPDRIINRYIGRFDNMLLPVSRRQDTADRHPLEYRAVFAGIPKYILHHKTVDTGGDQQFSVLNELWMCQAVIAEQVLR